MSEPEIDLTFIPFQVFDLELSLPWQDLEAGPGRVMALVRLHSWPLGVVEASYEYGEDPRQALAGRIWQELGGEINAHLRADGLPELDCLDPSALGQEGLPRCLEERERLLQDAPPVSVVVATRDRVDTLGPCLESLLAQHYPDFDIIVVDNAPPSDATEVFIREQYAGSGRVRYVREDLPGLASAHNRGLAEAGAPYIAITDDDVIADRYWLAGIMSAFLDTAHPSGAAGEAAVPVKAAGAGSRVGCVTGMIFPAEISTQAQYWLERSVGYAKGFSRRAFDLHDNRPDHPLFPYAAGMFGSGANMAFDTEVIRSLGGFDDHLGAGSPALGGDDLAAFFQVVSSGYALVYQPAAVVFHRHHREYERLRKTAYGYGAGLTAFLAKTIFDRPTRLFDIARRVPQGLSYAFSKRSPKNARKGVGYPPELTRIERRGMLAGAFLYARSRLKGR